jgi:protein-L-isoaspartate O-methyltransferase
MVKTFVRPFSLESLYRGIALVATQIRNVSFEYALGYTAAEHDRLIRQATLIAPITERLFREAGVGAGQRVLDIGSGLGDVSMIVARLVGPSGEVVGLERDANSISRAQERIAAVGFRNVHFVQTDVNDLLDHQPFDAVVGRFILMFLPDPLSVLQSAERLLRPGGVMAFQETSWIGMLAMAAPLPLWSRLLGAIHETFLRAGLNPEMGLDLWREFQAIGLPAPELHLDMLLGADATFTAIMSDLLCSVRPLAEQHNVPLDELGDFETLFARIQTEIAAANTVVGVVPMVSVWSRKPVVSRS